MIEAMACGTPIITYNRGAVSEIVLDGITGFVCPPNDEQAMCEAINKINSLPPEQYLKMRQACRQRVIDLFSAQIMVDQYEELYSRVIKSNQGGKQ
jgi:glycosyltransferase involved in cell wall biosynthesis